MNTSIGNLEAELSVTDLRSEDRIAEGLERHHALRLRRRGQPIGVLVDAELWTQIQARLERLEATVEAYEDEAVLALIAERTEAEFVPATDENIADAFAQYEALLEGHRATERSD